MTPTRNTDEVAADPRRDAPGGQACATGGEAASLQYVDRIRRRISRRPTRARSGSTSAGPTVYDFAHIGNARPVIVFDVLFRLLRHLYGASEVIYVRNITDVDDKINARAERDYPATCRSTRRSRK